MAGVFVASAVLLAAALGCSHGVGQGSAPGFTVGSSKTSVQHCRNPLPATNFVVFDGRQMSVVSANSRVRAVPEPGLPSVKGDGHTLNVGPAAASLAISHARCVLAYATFDSGRKGQTIAEIPLPSGGRRVWLDGTNSGYPPESFAWSPDDRRVAFISSAANRGSRYTRSVVRVVNVSDGAVRTVVSRSLSLPVTRVAWAGNSALLAIVQRGTPGVPSDNAIMAYPLDGPPTLLVAPSDVGLADFDQTSLALDYRTGSLLIGGYMTASVKSTKLATLYIYDLSSHALTPVPGSVGAHDAVSGPGNAVAFVSGHRNHSDQRIVVLRDGARTILPISIDTGWRALLAW